MDPTDDRVLRRNKRRECLDQGFAVSLAEKGAIIIWRWHMVVIRDAGGGRYEVHAEGRHWETFNQASGALILAQGLARRVAVAKGRAVMITTPWGNRSVESPIADASRTRS